MAEMFPEHPGLAWMALALIVFNLVVTLGAIRDGSITILQRMAQVLIVWVLPLLGAIVIYFVLAYHHTREEMKGLFPFPFYLIHRGPKGPTGFDDTSFPEGTCGGD